MDFSVYLLRPSTDLSCLKTSLFGHYSLLFTGLSGSECNYLHHVAWRQDEDCRAIRYQVEKSTKLSGEFLGTYRGDATIKIQELEDIAKEMNLNKSSPGKSVCYDLFRNNCQSFVVKVCRQFKWRVPWTVTDAIAVGAVLGTIIALVVARYGNNPDLSSFFIVSLFTLFVQFIYTPMFPFVLFLILAMISIAAIFYVENNVAEDGEEEEEGEIGKK